LEILDPALNRQALDILQTRCASCHGSANIANINYITDLNLLVGRGLVVPGNSAGSRLFIRTSQGSMPPAGALSTADIDTLKRWIDQGLAFKGDPTVALAPVINFAPDTSELTKQAVTLLSNRCASCHNEATGATTGGGVLNMRDPAIIVATGLAFAGRATQSPLYNAVSTNRMPKNGVAFTTAEKNLIRQWIDTDLANNIRPLVGGVVPVLTPTFASLNRHIFATRCLLCHGGSLGVRDDVNVSTYNGVRAAAEGIYEQTLEGEMPQRFPALTNFEVETIRAWIDAGRPNN